MPAPTVLSHASRPGPARAAAVAGLGHCRTPAAARMLAAVLAEGPAEGLARTAARALGHVGSSGALAADKSASPADAELIRRTAARALVLAMPGYRREMARACARAVLMIEHPATFAWIARVRPAASPALRGELGRIETRLARNLARARR